MIDVLDLARGGASLPVTDGAEVNLAQADTFSSGTTYKDFICDVKLVA